MGETFKTIKFVYDNGNQESSEKMHELFREYETNKK